MLSAVTALAGLAGIGYGISRANRKKAETESATRSKVSDALKESAVEASGQADAAVVDIVNAIRIDQLLKKLAMIDRNKAGADQEIRILKAEVQKLLTTHRGGPNGIHGFLGETSQVHIANVKSFINGDEPLYILLDDNSMTDYVRGMQIIQQKACQAGGHLGLDAIKRHMEKYPEFVEKGGIYQIPKDMFEKYAHLKNLPRDVAMKLRKEDLRLWKYIRSFTEKHPEATIEPMEVSYTDIQAGNIETTVKAVERDKDQEFEKQRNAAQKEYAPSFEEFLKICGVSAAIEGGVSAGTEFILKLKSGKKLSDFTRQDVKDIFSSFSVGCGKGALRGGIVYIVTNIIKTPAAVIAGLITALFGIIREGYLYFKKKIPEEMFLKNSMFTVVETAVSTGCAAIGRHLWKNHPIIGAIAGSILGSSGAGLFRRVAFA